MVEQINTFNNGSDSESEDDDEVYIGQRDADGLRHGKGELRTREDNCLIYSGDWVSDKRHGQGEEFDFDGKLQFAGTFANDEWHGQGTIYYPNGTVY